MNCRGAQTVPGNPEVSHRVGAAWGRESSRNRTEKGIVFLEHGSARVSLEELSGVEVFLRSRTGSETAPPEPLALWS